MHKILLEIVFQKAQVYSVLYVEHFLMQDLTIDCALYHDSAAYFRLNVIPGLCENSVPLT